MADLTLPSRASRDLSNEQLMNIARRFGVALSDPRTGLPANDPVCQALVTQIVEGAGHMAARLTLELASTFTKGKQRNEKLRDDYVRAIRTGLKQIVNDVDPALPPSRKEAAERLSALLAKRPKNFEKKSGAENSEQLEALFKDFDSVNAQAALQETNLLRYYQPLKVAHTAYVDLVRAQEESEAAAALATPVENPRKLPSLAVLKNTLVARLRLLLENIAFMAGLGTAPYSRLAEVCSAILSEISEVVKTRETREVNAEAKTSLAS